MSIGNMVPVEEYRDLRRDTHSNSIVNTNRDAYLNAKMKKNVLAQQKSEHAQMKKQIEELMKRCEVLEHQVSKLAGINS
jgi:hypothetical protein